MKSKHMYLCQLQQSVGCTVNPLIGREKEGYEIEPWDINIKVLSKGYMLGYHLLDTIKIKLLYRLLSKVGDQLMKM